MNAEAFIRYELVMGTMRHLLRKGKINRKDYEKAQKMMLEKYQPAAGNTFSDLNK